MKLLPIGVALAMLVPTALHGQDLPSWVLTLSKIKRQAKAELLRIPNYACLETINRSHKLPGPQPFKPVDTLRIEVAFIDGKELFAPEGATQFQDVNLSAFTSQGSIGTDTFTSIARNLFVNNGGLTTGNGEEKLGDIAAIWYGYKLPELSNAFLVQGAGAEAYVGEEGKFWVDATSLELLRIEDHAVDIPEYLQIRDVATTIEYNKVEIGPSPVLLPRTAVSLVTDTNGHQNKNVTGFTNCREYQSESLIHFGPDDDPPKPPAKKK